MAKRKGGKMTVKCKDGKCCTYKKGTTKAIRCWVPGKKKRRRR